MQKQVIPVNPALLRWARCTAGLSLKEAVERANIMIPHKRKDEEQITAEERLAAWEEGQGLTLPQLKSLANAYCRPLVTFFLAEPPAQASPLVDYRTVPDTPPNESPEFAALKRHIFQLHRELLAIAKDEQADAVSFVNSCSIQDGVPAVVHAMRRALGIEPVRAYDAFRSLRERAEVAGVYVVLMGDLGSHHSKGPERISGDRHCRPIRSPYCHKQL